LPHGWHAFPNEPQGSLVFSASGPSQRGIRPTVNVNLTPGTSFPQSVNQYESAIASRMSVDSRPTLAVRAQSAGSSHGYRATWTFAVASSTGHSVRSRNTVLSVPTWAGVVNVNVATVDTAAGRALTNRILRSVKPTLNLH
jgi:hypothetical protein